MSISAVLCTGYIVSYFGHPPIHHLFLLLHADRSRTDRRLIQLSAVFLLVVLKEDLLVLI